MTRSVNLRIIAAPAPQLGLRNEAGLLSLEFTAEPGTSNTIQTATSPRGAWTDWTNIVGNGTLQLLPLNSLPQQSNLYFRAFTP